MGVVMGAGDAAVWEDVAALVDPVVVHLVGQASQSMASNATNAIQFGTNSTVLDTHSSHNEASNNTRVTPPAGLYRVQGKVCFGARADYRITDAFLRLNGATTVDGSSGRNNASTYSGTNGTTSTEQVADTGVNYIEFDGTDYVELMGVQTNVAAADPGLSATGARRSTLSLERIGA